MAEEIGSLKVSLSLDGADFSRSMASVDRSLKTLGQEMRINQNQGKVWGNSITGLSTKQESLTRMLTAQELKVQKLNESYQKSVEETGENSKQTENLATQLNRATAEYTRTENELGQVTAALKRQKDELRLSESGWTQLGEKMRTVGSTMKKVGDDMASVGKDLTMKLTAPIVAVGTALAGITLKKGFDRLVGIDTARAKLVGLGHDAKGVETIMTSALDAVRGTSFGMDEAATTAAGAVAAGVKSGQELTKYLSTAGDAAAIAGVSLSEMGSIFNKVQTSQVAYTDNLNQLADRGIPIYQWLAEEAGVSMDKVKKMTSDGKISSEMFLAAVEKNIGGAAQKIGEESFTAGIDNMWAAVGRLGASFLDAGGKGGGFFSTLKPLIADITTNLDGLGGIAESVGVKFGEMFTGFIEKIKGVKQWFDNLSPSIQNLVKNIAIFGTIGAVAIGPVLLVLGKLIGVVGSALTLFGTISGAIAVMSTGVASAVPAVSALAGVFTVLTGPIGLAIAGIALITAGTIGLVNHFSKDAIPEVERFGDGVSDATGKAVGGFMNMTEEANAALKGLVWGQQEVTAELARTMSEAQAEITNNLLEAIQGRHNAEIEATQAQFENITALTNEQKMAIIERTNQRFDEEAVSVETGTARINEIYQQASDAGRAITRAESEEILFIREQMTAQAVEVMTQNQEEQRLIYERMKDNATTLSALEAAEVVQNATKKKEDVVNEAETQFTETRLWAEQQRDELGIMSAEEAQLVIDEAARKRDESVTAATKMHENVVSEARLQAEEHIELVDWETGEILSKWDVFVNGVKAFMKDLGSALADSGKAMWTATSEWFTKIYNTIKEKVTSSGIEVLKYFAKMVVDGRTKFNELVITTAQKFNEVKAEIKTKLVEAVTEVGTQIGKMPGKVREKVSNMTTAGKDLIKGLISGIKDMATSALNAITGVVDGVVNKAKSLLKIKSPSRVFKEMGGFVTSGLAIGIASKEQEANKAISKVTQGIIDDSRNIIVGGTEDTNNEVAEINKKAKEETSQLEKRSAEDVRLIHSKAKAAKRKITESEAIRIRRLEEDSAKKIKNINMKAAAEITKITSGAETDRIKNLQSYITDKRKLEELSLKDEVAIWQESVKHFKSGTDEKKSAMLSLRDAKRAVDKEVLDDGLAQIDALKKQGELSLANELKLLNELEKNFTNEKGNSKYEAIQQRKADIVKQVNTQIESMNKDYLAQTKKIVDDLIKEEQRLQDEYEKTVDDRARTLASFTNLFDGFKIEDSPMASDLMKNLNEQVIGLQNWQITIADLSSKAIDEGLLEELRQMGPKALPELKALNSMTNDQLTAYSNLYQQKAAIARNQAEAELVGMRKDTEKRIEEMRKAADKELSVMEKEWISKVKAITTETDVVLKTLKDVGINAGKGLMDGLAGMEGPLVNKARSIAESIKKAMSDAFDIHSPSRWMRDHIAGNMGIGWIKGIDGMKQDMLQAASRMSTWMMPEIPQFAGIGTPKFADKGATTTQFNQPQTIHIQPAPIYLDGREIGEVVFDTVDNLHANNYKATAYMRGG